MQSNGNRKLHTREMNFAPRPLSPNFQFARLKLSDTTVRLKNARCVGSRFVRELLLLPTLTSTSRASRNTLFRSFILLDELFANIRRCRKFRRFIGATASANAKAELYERASWKAICAVLGYVLKY
uniref:Uncharacterized protein n=1 Tax=Trichogramma kaykai TaxID=54128 RepID=A0ABD2XQT6_9HYME